MTRSSRKYWLLRKLSAGEYSMAPREPCKTIWGTKIWGTYLHHEQHVPAKQRCMYFQLQPSVHSSHLNKQKTESACSTLTRGVISEAPFRPQCAGTSCGRLMLGDAAPHNGTRSGGQGPHANLQRLVLAQGQYGS